MLKHGNSSWTFDVTVPQRECICWCRRVACGVFSLGARPTHWSGSPPPGSSLLHLSGGARLLENQLLLGVVGGVVVPTGLVHVLHLLRTHNTLSARTGKTVSNLTQSKSRCHVSRSRLTLQRAASPHHHVPGTPRCASCRPDLRRCAAADSSTSRCRRRR